jgi:uncharacterized protein YdaU (DUF1376 family)
MSARELPMPFFVKDWIGATLHWPCAERGAYISFLAFQWVNELLPADEAQLARIAGIDPQDFPRVWGTVGKKFDGDERGLYNNRLEEVRKEALRLRDTRVQGASISNDKRRAKRSARHDAENDAELYAERDAQRIAGRNGEHSVSVALPGASPLSLLPPASPSSLSVSLSPITPLSSSLSSSSSPSILPHTPQRADGSAGKKKKSVGPVDETHPQWLEFKYGYPLRAGGQPWKLACSCWFARRAEGYTHEQIIQGRDRYARFCEATGKIRTETVMQAKTFLGPDKHFLADWDLPVDGALDERWSPPSDEVDEPP